MHRTCAGISQPVFQAVSSTSAPFLCLYCRNLKQEEKITDLESTITDRKEEINDLKKGNQPATNEPRLDLQPSQPSFADIFQTNLPPTLGGPPPAPSSPSTYEERKYNIVVYGIKECAKGSMRHNRLTNTTV